MIVVHRLDVSDDQRERIAQIIRPADSKQLATRAEITTFLDNLLEGALGSGSGGAWERRKAELEAAGKSPAYIEAYRRGWLAPAR